MKKNIYKISAGVLLVLLGAFAYTKYGKKKTTPTIDSEVASLFDPKTTPTEYSVLFENMTDSGTKFWTDGKMFYKQVFGPLVKPGRPQEITQGEYIKNYVK